MYQELYIATLAVKERRRTDEEENFNVRFGKAVRVLREDIPRFFQRPQNMDIFRVSGACYCSQALLASKAAFTSSWWSSLIQEKPAAGGRAIH